MYHVEMIYDRNTFYKVRRFYRSIREEQEFFEGAIQKILQKHKLSIDFEHTANDSHITITKTQKT